jgi:LacI family transcriptional regulator
MRQKLVRANIKDVASVAGVSVQTVSRVLNERPDVSPETRKRVKEVMKQVGYRPSALARSLSSQRSYTLGVITAGLDYMGPSSTLSGIAWVAKEAGYSLLLDELPSFESDNLEPIFQAMLSRHVDGIIWAVPEVGANRKWVNHPPINLEVPLVYLTMAARENLSIVSVDNYLGGRMAMSHLLEQGYSHIGHITGPLDWWEARQRMSAWKDALMEASLESDDRYCAAGNWSPASGASAIEKLLDQYPVMDAVFVANDQMALGAMKFLSEKKVRIPDDIAMVGFDNIPEAAFFSPALTTVQQDQHQVAKIAVAELIKVIESAWQGLDPVHPKSVLLPPTLVVRTSSLRTRE